MQTNAREIELLVACHQLLHTVFPDVPNAEVLREIVDLIRIGAFHSGKKHGASLFPSRSALCVTDRRSYLLEVSREIIKGFLFVLFVLIFHNRLSGKIRTVSVRVKASLPTGS